MKLRTKQIALAGIIAGLYIVLVYAFAPISFAAIQFRVANILLVSLAFAPEFFFGIVIGRVIGNLLSPFNLVWELGVLNILNFGIILPTYFILRSIARKKPELKNKLYFVFMLVNIVQVSVFVAGMFKFTIGLPFLPIFGSTVLSTAIAIALGHIIVRPILFKLGFKLFE